MTDPNAATRALPDPLPGDTTFRPGEVIGGFRVERLLGQGGMGAVYLATQVSLSRQVALKVLAPHFSKDASFVARFDREAAALAALSHPNIVAIIDRGHDGDRYYFVMELIEGTNLRDVLKQGRVPIEQAARMVPQICEALEYAHGRGILHRDIKPENLLLTRTGHVKIADFGLARLTQGTEATGAPALTVTETVMGTRDYMAPESRRSAKEADHRADLYAVGVVLYEMLTGTLPLGRFEPPSAKGVDSRLDDVVHKALEPDPAKRYQRASEISRDVTRITSSVGVAPPAPRRRVPAWAIGSGAAALLLGAWLLLRGGPGIHAPFDDLLKAHVADGRVDYAALKRDREALDGYLKALEKTDPESLDQVSARTALWINAYNAHALRRVLDAYPVRGVDEIRSWDSLEDCVVGDEKYSLDQIRDAARKLNRMALFAMTPPRLSSPDLASEAYTEEGLEKQLEAAARRLLADPKKGCATGMEKGLMGFGKEKPSIRISPLFRTYRPDFETPTGELLPTLTPWLPAEAQAFLQSHPGLSPGYLDENKDLNGE